ncbi:MAG: sugar transferase [Phycisphaerae bacterium]|nr:sugar transferase [Phycisphaerae bacterium]
MSAQLRYIPLPSEAVTAPVIPAAVDESRPRLWGLTPAAMHDAFWRAHGVECVRRGAAGEMPIAGADAYLLLEPDQLVIFDLRSIAQALHWTRAAICRMRVVEAGDESYRERVRCGEDGLVKRIERVYSREYRSGYRVLLTDRGSIARLWHAAPTRRDAWRGFRRGSRAIHTEAFRVDGWSYRCGDALDEDRMMARLVDQWSDPERAIDGIASLGNGIFGLKGAQIANDRTLVGPLWLGGGVTDGSATDRSGSGTGIVVGPTWLPDRAAVNAVRVLDVADILSPERGDATEAAGGLRRAERPVYHLCKRAVDIAVSAAVLAMLLPILAIVSIAVIADDGFPVLFGHRRQTKGGRVFRCWKFRTMRRNAEALAKELRSLNVCDGPQFFIQNDPRVTRVGKLLRKWHLDELPQLWNVLVGDMSLVGPRPSPDGENQFCPAWRELRLSVRPGMTGLWQVERTREPGRDFQEWIRYDLEYVSKASLWLDLTICVKTIANIVGRRGS